MQDLPLLLFLLLPPVTTPPQQLGLELRPHLALPNLFYLSLEVGRERPGSLSESGYRAVKPSSLLGLIDPVSIGLEPVYKTSVLCILKAYFILL